MFTRGPDEMEELLFSSEFPPIINNEEREVYKRLFDKDHQEYKELQAGMDQINKRLAEVDRELDDLQEGSPQFLVWNVSLRRSQKYWNILIIYSMLL